MTANPTAGGWRRQAIINSLIPNENEYIFILLIRRQLLATCDLRPATSDL